MQKNQVIYLKKIKSLSIRGVPSTDRRRSVMWKYTSKQFWMCVDTEYLIEWYIYLLCGWWLHHFRITSIYADVITKINIKGVFRKKNKKTKTSLLLWLLDPSIWCLLYDQSNVLSIFFVIFYLYFIDLWKLQ